MKNLTKTDVAGICRGLETLALSIRFRSVAKYGKAGMRSSRYAKWDESKHPRGQPENAGQFVEADAVGKARIELIAQQVADGKLSATQAKKRLVEAGLRAYGAALSHRIRELTGAERNSDRPLAGIETDEPEINEVALPEPSEEEQEKDLAREMQADLVEQIQDKLTERFGEGERSQKSKSRYWIDGLVRVSDHQLPRQYGEKTIDIVAQVKWSQGGHLTPTLTVNDMPFNPQHLDRVLEHVGKLAGKIKSDSE